MRTLPALAAMMAPVIVGTLGAGMLVMPLAPAAAQITTNEGALDALGPATPRPHRRPARPTRHSAPHSPARTAGPATPKPSTPVPAAPPSVAPAPATKPAISAIPPAILALPPAVAVPLAHPPPAPAIPLVADAPGTAAPLQNGVRITFGPDRADLNQDTVDALSQFAHTVAAQPTTSINIFAYANGNPGDPSTPRRLSLQRALAARAVLLNAGIASARIYPRALGPAGGEEPDRVDVVTGTNTPPPVGTAG